MADPKVEGRKEDLNQAYDRATMGPHFLTSLARCGDVKRVTRIEHGQDPAMEFAQKLRGESCGSGWRGLYQRFSKNCAKARENLRNLEEGIQAAGERAFRECIVEGGPRKTEGK